MVLGLFFWCRHFAASCLSGKIMALLWQGDLDGCVLAQFLKHRSTDVVRK